MHGSRAQGYVLVQDREVMVSGGEHVWYLSDGLGTFGENKDRITKQIVSFHAKLTEWVSPSFTVPLEDRRVENIAMMRKVPFHNARYLDRTTAFIFFFNNSA